MPDFLGGRRPGSPGGCSALLREAEAFDEASLSTVERIDKRLAQGFLRIQQWEYESDHFQWQSLAVHRRGGFCRDRSFSYGLCSLRRTCRRSHYPHAEDRRPARTGCANVRRAPPAWTERRCANARGAKAFFGQGIDILAGEPGLLAPYGAAADAALAAFARYERYLAEELSQAPIPAPACGAAVLQLLLAEGIVSTVRRTTFSPTRWPRWTKRKPRWSNTPATLIPATKPPATGGRRWPGSREIHPTVDGYLGRYAELWESSRQLVRDADLLTWPDFPIEYTPQPLWARRGPSSLLYGWAPAAFNRPPVHRYLVTPIEPFMPEAEQLRRLQATNDSVIKLNHVVHHGGVGHHVQNFNAYHGASQIGRVAAVIAPHASPCSAAARWPKAGPAMPRS